MIEPIFIRFAGQPFKLDRLDDAASGRVSGADLRAALPGLLRSGELAAVKKAWGEKLYYIPQSRLPMLWERLTFTPLKPYEGSVQLQKEAGPGLQIDLFRALTWIARNGLPMTAKGTVHQKSIGKLTDHLFLREEDVAGLGLQYPHREAYPPQLAVVLDLLQALGMLERERTGWALNARELTAWLDLAPETMDAVLFRELLHRYVPDEAGIQHYVYRLAQSDLREGSWYAAPEVLASLRSLGMLPAGDLPEQSRMWFKSWLDALRGFGWLDIGTEGGSDTELIRWRRRPALNLPESAKDVYGEEGTIFIQPDFEILVPPEVSFRVRWELEACCDNQTTDIMSVYRLSRASVARAAELGRPPETVLELLESRSAGVPDNVRLALLQWAGELGRTSLQTVLLLRCKDEAAADTAASLPLLAGLLERIGPRDFIVDAEQEAKVRKVLEEARLAPPKPRNAASAAPEYPRLVESGSMPEPAGLSGEYSERAWIYSGRNLGFYDPADEPPGLDELFPGWHDIPGMWRGEMRDYHDSTKRKIMQQAVDWKAKVLLRLEGKNMEFIPAAITGEAGWKASGVLFPPDQDGGAGTAAELAPECWSAMRLLTPEIS
ncbi:helicase-associated domain-containing protein [Paenibacillus sp. M1]|uniref:Helicase-associated domain-containing protein n=1 Tax=Paenibacillus haidiansis TaxID=1574488 RepID=A0ABU7VLB5_9BACL